MREREMLNAFVWASSYCKGAIPFFALDVGKKFRFPSSEEVYEKTSKVGWYVSTTGKKYRTSVKAAVVAVIVEGAAK